MTKVYMKVPIKGQRNKEVDVFVPKRWVHIKDRPEVVAHVAKCLDREEVYALNSTSTPALDRAGYIAALRNAVKNGYGIQRSDVFHIFIGALNGIWRINEYPSAVWQPMDDYVERVDPWAWAIAKEATRNHLIEFMVRTGFHHFSYDMVRLRAFIRIWLREGARTAIKRLFPLMHPATRNTLLKVGPVNVRHGAGLRPADYLTDFRRIRHSHTSNVNIAYVLQFNDMNPADELVSRFGVPALLEYKQYRYEVFRAKFILPMKMWTPFETKLGRIEPARIWKKWHDDLVNALAEHGTAEEKAATEARQQLWDWVTHKKILQSMEKQGIKIRPLVTKQELLEEHKVMRHCIHSYGSSRDLLGHASFGDEEATFEIQQVPANEHEGRHFDLRQLCGPRNKEVSRDFLHAFRLFTSELNLWQGIDDARDEEDHEENKQCLMRSA